MKTLETMIEIAGHLRVKVRPSRKDPRVMVGEYFLVLAHLGLGIGLEVRFADQATLGDDPLVPATEAGLHAIQEYLAASAMALQSQKREMKDDAPHTDAEALPVPEEIKLLRQELTDLRTKYDALMLHGLGIGDV